MSQPYSEQPPRSKCVWHVCFLLGGAGFRVWLLGKAKVEVYIFRDDFGTCFSLAVSDIAR